MDKPPSSKRPIEEIKKESTESKPVSIKKESHPEKKP